MSTGTQTLRVTPRLERRTPGPARDLTSPAAHRVRLAWFAALALYGVIRWSTMLAPAPGGRLIGLFAVAVTLAGGVPWLRWRSPAAAIGLTVALVLVSVPIAGLPWHDFIHHRVAVGARDIGDGLQDLAGVLVPYRGASGPVELVIVLGAAVLLLDGAIALAFAPPEPSDLRRASTLLPLIALAIVPALLVRPELPYVQGLILFALIAAFLWGDRVRREAVGTAIAVATLAGVAGAIVAPKIDPHSALVNYRAWAGSLSSGHLDTFDWDQTYGPLRWPKTGHTVLTVRARQGDYWKAEDLDLFNGYAWVGGGFINTQQLPAPERSALARWTQEVQVTIQGMRTADVIAAGSAARPSIPGVVPGVDPGTWTSYDILGPGNVYEVSTYSPSPSAAQLRSAGLKYPNRKLTDYRTLSIPYPQVPISDFPAIAFPPFHSRLAPSLEVPRATPTAAQLVGSSPYASAYALARRLEAHASTPYAFVYAVEQYLSHGFRYSENPQLTRYPLETFLFEDKLGYCQQFSGAMALLLRMGGIPARVAAGFTSGAYDSASHRWVVSDLDAHAWVEVWFPRYGWVRFDPTPASAPARAGSGLEPIDKRLIVGGTTHAAIVPRRHLSPTASVTTSRRHAAPGAGPPLLLIVAVSLGGLAVLALGVIGLRRPPDEDRLLAELERALARSGRPLEGGVTLAALEQRFRDTPAAAEYVRSLRLARYAGTPSQPTAAQRRALRQRLGSGLGLTGRLRALWALPPRSVLSPRTRSSGLKS